LRKEIIFCVAGAVALNVFTSAVYAQKITTQDKEKITAEYNIADRTLDITAKLQEGKKSFLNIIILPESVEFSEEAVKNNDDAILRTVQTDTTGEISPEIIMPTETTGKRFVCYINTDKEQVKHRFSTVAASQVEEIAKKVNKTDKDGIKALINDDIVQSGLGIENEKNSEIIARYVYSQKPSAGYSANDFLNTYMVGEGVAYLAENEISLSEFVEEYGAYLDMDYADKYDSLTETERKALEDMFAVNKPIDGFDTTFDKNLFLAKYRVAESSIDLGELVTEYFTRNNISMSKFNQITNNLYKDDIFAQMYINRAQAVSAEKITEEFNGLVDAALEKSEGNPGGGASGGGSGGSGGSGGLGGWERPTMTVEGGSVNIGNEMFFDIASHWAKNQIESACNKGIVAGFENGTFQPDKNVTRAEFAKMVAQALGLKTTLISSDIFKDVSADAWYNVYVSANAEAGIIFGDDNNNFNPQADITRQDVAVMLSRALAYKGVSLENNNFGFADEANFAPYAAEAINTLATAGIVNGYSDKTFLPEKTASRAEAVVMIMRMEELIGE